MEDTDATNAPPAHSDPLPIPVRLPHLPIVRARITYRLLTATTLPPYKGALLRGGFGYAFQRSVCPRACWNRSEHCTLTALCPFRQIFEPPRPAQIAGLREAQDVPRGFVLEPPLDGKRQYAAGDSLEFYLVLFGRASAHLPHFIYGFEQLGREGLGRDHAPARLERVEVLRPWQPTGVTAYLDGRASADTRVLPTLDGAQIVAHATKLPADLRLTLPTPLRVKARGAFISRVELPALVQAACWRLTALAAFYDAPWDTDYRPIVAEAHMVRVEQAAIRWVDWERTSTRTAQPRQMTLGGLIGSVVLREVPLAVRAVLLAGTLIHIGKASVFGHGKSELAPINPSSADVQGAGTGYHAPQ